jgi:hypothetical protein
VIIHWENIQPGDVMPLVTYFFIKFK